MRSHVHIPGKKKLLVMSSSLPKPWHVELPETCVGER